MNRKYLVVDAFYHREYLSSAKGYGKEIATDFMEKIPLREENQGKKEARVNSLSRKAGANIHQGIHQGGEYLVGRLVWFTKGDPRPDSWLQGERG